MMKTWASVTCTREDLRASAIWATGLASLFIIPWIDWRYRIAALKDNWRSDTVISRVWISLRHHRTSTVWGLSQSCHAGISILSLRITGFPGWWTLRISSFFLNYYLLSTMISSTVLWQTSSPRVIILILDRSIPSNLFLTLIRIQLACDHPRILSVLSSSPRRTLNTVFIVLLLLLDTVKHAFLSVISCELVFIGHELSLLLGVWIIGHWWAVLWCVHQTLGVPCCSTVYLHGTSSLAVAFRVASFVTLSIFATFFVERPTEGILVIRPLLLYKRLINALLVRVIALHLSIHSLLIVQALIKLFDNGSSFLIPSVVTASSPRIGLRDTKTAGAICHVHVFVPRLCSSACCSTWKEATSDRFSGIWNLGSVIDTGTRLIFFWVCSLVRARLTRLDYHVLLSLNIVWLARRVWAWGRIHFLSVGCDARLWGVDRSLCWSN